MATIRNRVELLQQGRSSLREVAIDIADSGLSAIDPAQGVARNVKREANRVSVAGREYDIDGPVHLLGAGKATLAMAAALEEILDDALTGGLIVVPDGHDRELRRVKVLTGDHPIPGERSSEAGVAVMEYARQVNPGELVLCVFTGGSSALVSVAPEGVSPEGKKHMHSLLVNSGLDIVRMNTVRKHVSRIKGGRLARLLDGSPIVNLTVSDVAGDIVDAVTDLTVEDTTSRSDAIEVLRTTGLWHAVDASIRAHLESESSESPSLDTRSIQTVMVANGQTACEAMLSKARTLGMNAEILSVDWGGDAGRFGRYLASAGVDRAGSALVGCGGETTVELTDSDSAGSGGPNQELAVAAGLAFDGSREVALVALDTDGSDGATSIAGGLVDDMTSDIWAAADVDAAGLLASHRSSDALQAIGQAVTTGPTMTNVNDLFVLVVEP